MLSNIRYPASRARVLSWSVVAVAVVALSWGADSNVAWAQCDTAKLLASDGTADDRFGRSVAVSGDVVVVGLPHDDDNGLNSGSAYVSRYNGSTWIQEQKLRASDGGSVDSFGRSVGISGNVIVVGSPGDDDNGTNSGAAYVFRFNGSMWVEIFKLFASDGAASDAFGTAVAISGDDIVVGAYRNDDNGDDSGSAYIFHFDGSSWFEEDKLLPSDGAIADWFGFSVSISGSTVIIGAHLDGDPFETPGSAHGSAYVFSSNGSTWFQEQKLLASDAAGNDRFGFSVGISGDVAVVGAYLDDNANGVDAGSAYVFGFNGSSWLEEAKLLASDGAGLDDFGSSVAVSGDVAVVGTPGDDDNGTVSGSAYVFGYSGSSWSQEQKLLASDGSTADEFGGAVAVSGDVAVVGAHQDDDNGANAGSAYVFAGACISAGCEFDIECDDADACTDDICDAGVCVSVSVNCGPGEECVSGACVPTDCMFHSDCDDADACTTDLCLSGVCVLVSLDCPDGEVCVDGACQPEVGCTFHSDCNDFNLCTTDVCSSGTCFHTPINCNDGNACTVDSCNAGSGCVHDPVSCPVGESCVDGFCEPDGCTFHSDCNDFDLCTTDVCSSGNCFNFQISCNDGNACTVDSCNSGSGCVHDPITCPLGESCVNGLCEPDGCTFNSDCNDFDLCTSDVCSSGTCFHFQINCNDGNACTADSCDPASGCVSDQINCNDGNLCTVDSCNPASGCVNDWMTCPIGETCVDGVCETPAGCVYHSHCNDANACTTDLCISGQCLFVPLDCPDGEVCEDGVCQPAGGGCIFNGECNDFDACTTDLCISGTCSNTPMTCNDGDACTVDRCSSGTCFFDLIDCDDGDPCTDDMCFDGVCDSSFPECGWADGCCGPSCDGGNDPDCSSCLPGGTVCTENSDCCSLKCRGRNGNKKCKGN